MPGVKASVDEQLALDLQQLGLDTDSKEAKLEGKPPAGQIIAIEMPRIQDGTEVLVPPQQLPQPQVIVPREQLPQPHDVAPTQLLSPPESEDPNLWGSGSDDSTFHEQISESDVSLSYDTSHDSPLSPASSGNRPLGLTETVVEIEVTADVPTPKFEQASA